MVGINLGAGRTASTSDLSGALALLEAASNPQRTKEALTELKTAADAVEAHEVAALKAQNAAKAAEAKATAQLAKAVAAEERAVAAKAAAEAAEKRLATQTADLHKLSLTIKDEQTIREEKLKALDEDLKATSKSLTSREVAISAREANFDRMVSEKEAEISVIKEKLTAALTAAEAAKSDAESRVEKIKALAAGN